MDKKIVLFGLCMALCSTTMAQQKQGGITAEMLQSFSKKQTSSIQNKALYNAITSNSIDDLARNHANAGAIDTYFSVETIKQKIQNQKNSGRCWMFTGFNVLRGNFAKAHKDSINVEFSHAYLFFYDQLEKSNLMLQGVINTANKALDDKDVQFFFRIPINDGGTFCGVADLVDKYGLVPMEVIPETYSAENTKRMASIVSSKLREFGLELREMLNKGKKTAEVQKRKTEMLSTIYNILSLTLGEPVKQFNYAFKDKNGKTVTPLKSYTPQSFYQETVGKPQKGSFIMAMNDPSRPYYKVYEIDQDRHTYDGQNWKYINLPMEDIYTLAINSLKDGTKLYTSYDVGKQLDKNRGYLDLDNYDYGSLFNTSFGMNKAQRIPTFDSSSTHAMTLTAVDLDANGNPKKWKVENSWGKEYGHHGYLIMSKKWFDEYFFRIVVDKKYVPAHILKLENQKSIMLPYDDPMFSIEQ